MLRHWGARLVLAGIIAVAVNVGTTAAAFAAPPPSPGPTQPAPTADPCKGYPLIARPACRAKQAYDQTRGNGGSIPEAVGNAVTAPVSDVLDTFNPMNAFGQVAKDMAIMGFDLMKQMGGNIHKATHYNPTAPWFLRQYALSFGISLALMVGVLLHTMARTAGRGADGDEAFHAVFGWFPAALLLAMFGPALAWYVSGGIDDISEIALKAAGADADAFLSHALKTFSNLDPASLLGGVGSLFLFGVWAAAAGTVLFFEQVAREFGLYLSSFFMPFALAFMINRRSRHITGRALALWVGLLLIKPIIFFTYGLIWAAASNLNGGATLRDGFSTIMFLLAGATVVAFMPALIAKYVPAAFSGLNDASTAGQAVARPMVSAAQATRSKIVGKMPQAASASAGMTRQGSAMASRGVARGTKAAVGKAGGAAGATGRAFKEAGKVFEPDVQRAKQALGRGAGSAKPAATSPAVPRSGRAPTSTGKPAASSPARPRQAPAGPAPAAGDQAPGPAARPHKRYQVPTDDGGKAK